MNQGKKRFGLLLILFGCLLVAAAVAVTVGGIFGRKQNAEHNGEVLAFLESILPEKSVGFREEKGDPSMPVIEFEENDYVGILEVPRFSVSLPIAANWSKSLVRSVPCRFTGSVFDGTLILGGTGEEGQFDFIPSLDIGDGITFTDLKGEVFSFSVKKVLHASDASLKTLTDPDYPLTLFAKDPSSGSTLVVRCIGA